MLIYEYPMTPSIDVPIFEDVTNIEIGKLSENEGLKTRGGRCYAFLGNVKVERTSVIFGPCLRCAKGVAIMDDILCEQCQKNGYNFDK